MNGAPSVGTRFRSPPLSYVTASQLDTLPKFMEVAVPTNRSCGNIKPK